MTKQQEWRRIAYLRGIIKDRQTTIVKDKNGNKKGGILLNDETVQPYVTELEALEAKMAKDKETMSTNERVDDAAEHVNAHNDANTERVLAHVSTCFEKLNPKKFKAQINKWAYIPAKGRADYYRTPAGTYVKRLGDIPPGCIFIHKIRIHEKIDDELDMYKYFHEDGTAGSAVGWDSFDFITLVGQGVELTGETPTRLQKYVGIEGIIKSEPVVKIPKDTDMFTIEFSGSRPIKIRRQFLKFLDEAEDEEQEEDQHKSNATSSTDCPESVADSKPPAKRANTSSSSSSSSDDAEDVTPMIEEVKDENETKDDKKTMEGAETKRDSDAPPVNSTAAEPPAPAHSKAEEDEYSYSSEEENKDQKKPDEICSEHGATWKLLRGTKKFIFGLGYMVDVIEDKLSKSLQCLPPCTEEQAIKRITQDVNGDIGRHYDTNLRAYPIMHDGHDCVRIGPSEIRGIVFGLVEA